MDNYSNNLSEIYQDEKAKRKKLPIWLTIILCIVISEILCGTIFFAYSKFFITKMYTSNASIYVDSKATQVVEQSQNNTANLVELTTAEMLVDTYIEILSSNSFCYNIKEKLKLPYSAGEIKSMITYSRVEETGVVHISVSAPSPNDAYEICSAVLLYANTQIEDVMKVGFVRTVDPATMPGKHSYPNDFKNAMVGVVLGTLISPLWIIFIVLKKLLKNA